MRSLFSNRLLGKRHIGGNRHTGRRTGLRPGLLLALSSALLPLAGCVVAAGAVGGVILSQEVLDEDALETRLDRPVRDVWPVVKHYLSSTSSELIEVDEEHTTARAKVYAAKVTVKVYGFNETQTVLLVSAKRAGFDDTEAAQHVTDQIVGRLSE